MGNAIARVVISLPLRLVSPKDATGDPRKMQNALLRVLLLLPAARGSRVPREQPDPASLSLRNRFALSTKMAKSIRRKQKRPRKQQRMDREHAEMARQLDAAFAKANNASQAKLKVTRDKVALA